MIRLMVCDIRSREFVMSVANFGKFKDYKGPSKNLVDLWWRALIDRMKRYLN